MCLDCGCGEPNESHGDSRHITLDSVRAAAQVSGISENEAMDNIAAGMRQARSSGGSQSQSDSGSGNGD
jgi:phage-related minor tail protein